MILFHPTPQVLHLIALPALLSFACSSPRSSVVGRWELADATNLLGQQGNPSTMQLKLLITRTHGDSVFGKAYAAFDPKAADERECGVLRGTRNGPAGVMVTIFTIDDPNMDMILEGRFRGDSLLITSARPRAGKNVLPWGSWLIFVRTSGDTITGCLTSA